MDYKYLFKRFLISYPSDMLPMPKSALRKLRQLADDFIKNVDERDYFDVFTMNDFLNVLKAKLGNEKAFFELKFHKRRYIHLLERWIKTLITHPYSLTDLCPQHQTIAVMTITSNLLMLIRMEFQ